MARRNIKIDLRLNESEAAMLNRDVEKSGLSREAYLRALIKHMPIKEKPPIEFTQMLKAMQQISNNMNQIAVKANSMHFVDTAAYWDNVKSLQKAIGDMVERMYD